EALLFAAARADHVEKTILPALKRGQWVLSDRFLDSSVAYQGFAGGLNGEEVYQLNDFACDGLFPDRTLVLITSEGSERARNRDGGTGDRIGGRDPAYHEAVDDGFLALHEQDPERVRLIDASGSPDAVTARLLEAIADLLP
ncbi:MAG: dTMP kinase, partial [Sphingomicrobium sp.]